MNEEQMQAFKDEMKVHIADTIRVVVNGKIDGLRDDFQDYVRGDEAWKVRAEPMVVAYTNARWSFKVFISLLKVLAAVGGAVGAVYSMYKIFK